jgi:hypothetical protein
MVSWFILSDLAVAAQPPALGGGGALPVDPVRILAGLGAGILLALLAAVLIARMKRRQGRAPGWLARLLPAGENAAEVHVIETRRASVHADFCVVSWDGRRYLIAVTPGGAALIDSREEGGRAAPAALETPQ